MKLIFPSLTHEDFEEKFLSMVKRGRNSSTYKFAFARFLLEYCNKDSVEEHIEFSTISEYFLKFYWNQVCKTKLNQSPKYRKEGGIKEPEIIPIITDEFLESYYPKNFDYYKEHAKTQIQNCIDKIPEKCFDDVVWRFQKINNEEPREPPFFEYKVKSGWTDPNRKHTDLTFGINLNPAFIEFVKENYDLLYDVVILEWARFLEKFNHTIPLIIPKLEGSEIKRDTAYMNRAKKELKKFHNNCFYCNTVLTGNRIDLEHVIPFDYISEDNIWNYALACQRCNCHKQGFLPPEEFINKLIENITTDRASIEMLDDSLNMLGNDFKEYIWNRYKSAKRSGYAPIEMPPNS